MSVCIGADSSTQVQEVYSALILGGSESIESLPTTPSNIIGDERSSAEEVRPSVGLSFCCCDVHVSFCIEENMKSLMFYIQRHPPSTIRLLQCSQIPIDAA
jgi:hypothetical protein